MYDSQSFVSQDPDWKPTIGDGRTFGLKQFVDFCARPVSSIAMLEEFLALSEIVAGVTNLAPQRGAEHLDRLISLPWAPRVIVPLGEGLMLIQEVAAINADIEKHPVPGLVQQGCVHLQAMADRLPQEMPS